MKKLNWAETLGFNMMFDVEKNHEVFTTNRDYGMGIMADDNISQISIIYSNMLDMCYNMSKVYPDTSRSNNGPQFEDFPIHIRRGVRVTYFNKSTFNKCFYKDVKYFIIDAPMSSIKNNLYRYSKGEKFYLPKELLFRYILEWLPFNSNDMEYDEKMLLLMTKIKLTKIMSKEI